MLECMANVFDCDRILLGTLVVRIKVESDLVLFGLSIASTLAGRLIDGDFVQNLSTPLRAA